MSNESGMKTDAYYKGVIHQMNVLSMAQTAFLKDLLKSKLVQGVGLIRRVLDILDESNIDNPQIPQIRSGIEELKLQDLHVDPSSAQLMLHDELSLLRKSVNFHLLDITGKSNDISSSSGTNSANGFDPEMEKKVIALESENSNLKADIKRLNFQLESNVAKPEAGVAAPSQQITINNAEMVEMKSKLDTLQGENARLLSQIEQLKNDVSASSSTLNTAKSTDSAEINRLKGVIDGLNAKIEQKDEAIRKFESEISSIKTDLNAASSSTSSTQSELQKSREQIKLLEKKLVDEANKAQTLLANRTKELEEESDRKIKDLEARLETEKEEMMDAMSQEIAEIEGSKDQEIQELTEKCNTIDSQVKSIQSEKEQLLHKLKATSGDLEVAKKTAEQSRRSLEGMKMSYDVVRRNVVVNRKKSSALMAKYNALSQDTKKDLQDMKQFLRMSLSSVANQMKMKDEELKSLLVRYRKEMTERKKLHNIIQELKGNIRVFLRCRPPTTKEIEQLGRENVCVSFPSPGEIRVFNDKNREKVWEFDEVFGLDSTQANVYQDVSDLVISVLDGYNVCIFAYGQTGSGKTFTMSGPTEDRGVNTRALSDLFARSQERVAEWRTTIKVSILEVYNEDIRDLLVDSQNQEKLEIRQGENGNYVPRLTSAEVTNIEQVFELISIADRNRSQTCTNMNEHSSRSHMMLTVNVISENRMSSVVARGKLNLVDLAGSERINKSGATGQALKEAQNINKSLSALGDVIAARASKAAHVPFRNSTLTYLLQDSLSNDSKTLMIVCISPMLFNAEESFCSLNFASRVRTVELGKASKNVSSTPTSSSNSSVASTSSGSSMGSNSTSVTPRTSAAGAPMSSSSGSRRLSTGPSMR